MLNESVSSSNGCAGVDYCAMTSYYFQKFLNFQNLFLLKEVVFLISFVLILSLEIVLLLWLALSQYGILIWIFERSFHWGFWIWNALSQQSFNSLKHISRFRSVLSTRISYTTFACFFLEGTLNFTDNSFIFDNTKVGLFMKRLCLK